MINLFVAYQQPDDGTVCRKLKKVIQTENSPYNVPNRKRKEKTFMYNRWENAVLIRKNLWYQAQTWLVASDLIYSMVFVFSDMDKNVCDTSFVRFVNFCVWIRMWFGSNICSLNVI